MSRDTASIIYKYSGAGNDFLVLRESGHGSLDAYRDAGRIKSLCDRKTGFVAADGRIGADGLMILSDSEGCDFRMDYYNSDGSGGMMCGNGGRCIVAFADELGLKPSNGRCFVFEAADGMHTGEVLSRSGGLKQIRIRMIDAFGMKEVLGGIFLNTGTRHFVKFVEDVDAVDIESEGYEYRWASDFAPEGANVNFVSVLADGKLKIRTFEKGVEAETLACGTGICAAAIAAYHKGIKPLPASPGERVSYGLQARINDLSVDFIPTDTAKDVYLSGPAELIA